MSWRRGTYNSSSRVTWGQFWDEYQGKVLDGADWGHRKETKLAVKSFERLVKPKRLTGIKSQMIDDYRTKRAQERRKGRDTTVSPATVNKELRHLKLVLNHAVDWGYLQKLPKFRMLREPEKLKRYVPPDDFAAIYNACDTATAPVEFPFEPVDWWRGLLVFAYMTGWRIGEILALRRDDVDLEAATAITRHGDNKGKRDDLVPLNAAVVDHLRKVPSFEPVMFPWYHRQRTLYKQFHAIQDAAGIQGDRYGFHDLRRGFATLNEGQLSPNELQAMMRHKSFETTKRYINMARQLNRTAEKVFVPDVLTKRG